MPRTTPSAKPPVPGRILIVDDDNVTRQVVSRMLDTAGFHTSQAADGLEALKLLRGHRFDLMVLDIWMPRMTGLDLLQKLATRRSRPRVVVLTSDEAPETLLKAVRGQAFKFLRKPAEAVLLVATVREALSAPNEPPIEVISA